jgi:hypothetical protein
MPDLNAFIAGFLSTLVFHQGLLALLHDAGLSSRAAFAAAPTWPLHLPAFVSLASWGGIWALALARLVRRFPPGAYWAAWVVLGALLPSVIAWFVVFPLKGLPLPNSEVVKLSLLLNGAWGLGAALILRAARHAGYDV